jgi:hypothetical protein
MSWSRCNGTQESGVRSEESGQESGVRSQDSLRTQESEVRTQEYRCRTGSSQEEDLVRLERKESTKDCLDTGSLALLPTGTGSTAALGEL